MLDFAVNVRPNQPSQWLVQRLAEQLLSIVSMARHPSSANVYQSLRRDRRPLSPSLRRDEVLQLAKVAVAFVLWPNLLLARAAVVALSLTELTVALAAAEVPLCHTILEPSFALDGPTLPEHADLVVVGNPTKSTPVLYAA